jgi:hypothetical protein
VNVVDMAVLLMLFEGATLLAMQAVGTTIPLLTGRLSLSIITGITGTAIALTPWNLLKLSVRCSFGKIERIAIIDAGIANTIFLAALWNTQGIISLKQGVTQTIIIGFIATAITLVVLLAAYNLQPLKIRIMLNGSKARIMRVSVLATAITAGIYEAIILPLQYVLAGQGIIAALVTGFLSGFIGGLAGTIIFNKLAGIIKPWIETR